jgi:hypothetical protein
VIASDDAGYEAARATFNGMLDRRPELVTRPLDVDDVAAAVGYALEAGLPGSQCAAVDTAWPGTAWATAEGQGAKYVDIQGDPNATQVARVGSLTNSPC